MSEHSVAEVEVGFLETNTGRKQAATYEAKMLLSRRVGMRSQGRRTETKDRGVSGRSRMNSIELFAGAGGLARSRGDVN